MNKCCVTSVRLTGMKLLVKSAGKLHQGAVLADGTQQVPIRVFMDDLTNTVK